MNYAAILHRTTDNDCYAIDDETIELNINTDYDIEKVYVYHGDPFAGGILGGNWQWEGEEVEIIEYCELQYHKRWTVHIKPTFKRLKYYFALQSKEEKVLYFEDGFYRPDEIDQEKKLQCFTMPWLNSSDVNVTPSWVKDTIWYQVFPDRFCNGNPKINPVGTLPWASKVPSNEDIYGGDLYGVLDKLDYLKDLGITGIYMTPIFLACSTHKYDTSDYFEIDPAFGDKGIFKKLVSEAHARGIKIMLDGVFNHCGRDFGPWKDVQKLGPKSKFFNWFMVNEWPFDTTKGHTHDKEFYSFAFTTGMPKLNTNNPEVIEYLCSIGAYWIKEFDIDGWRLDVANEVSHTFCKAFRKRMSACKSDIYILGEIWHDSIKWLQGDEFDAVMNYPLTTAINDFWIQKNSTNKQFEHQVNACYGKYMQQTNDVLFNLLDSHDTDRLIYRVHQNKDIFYQQMAILFTVPGSPCIFYGSEVVLDGAHDPYCRTCMPWDAIDNGSYRDEIMKMKQLIHIRKHYAACKSQNIEFKNSFDNERVIEYRKVYNGKVLSVIINASDTDIEIGDTNILFENNYKQGILKKNGVLIIETNEECK